MSKVHANSTVSWRSHLPDWRKELVKLQRALALLEEKLLTQQDLKSHSNLCTQRSNTLARIESLEQKIRNVSTGYHPLCGPTGYGTPDGGLPRVTVTPTKPRIPR